MSLDLSDPRVKQVMVNWIKVLGDYSKPNAEKLADAFMRHLKDVANDQAFLKDQFEWDR